MHTLMLKFCTTVLEVKYLDKYVYKAHDRAIIKIRSHKDNDKSGGEIFNYQEIGYVSACEAYYGIFSFELDANVPHVRLALHLENTQTVSFKETPDANSVLEDVKHSTLTG
eukprot:TRINITY_DN26194_c0_g1_i1.p1 TRINITY_DN26194_c0_g1~~TRINITY_DN26194_c0_g1_i1.p1  ORF type:complete len:111 (-),score=2.87 TRINITY_DN26194_c0_g1_i1:403-735(-)